MINYKAYKNASKIFSFILIILCLWQIYDILGGYYQRNKDSPNIWNLQEKYDVTNGQLPDLVKKISMQFQRFQFSCVALIIFASLVEYFKYKENPEKYNEKNKNSWTARTFRKLNSWAEKNIPSEENKNESTIRK
jgi:hypothetical protein